MKDFLLYILVVSFTLGLGIALPIQRAMAQEVPSGAPSAAVDLATKEGVAAGADSQPSGAPVRTYDYTPHAAHRTRAKTLTIRVGRQSIPRHWTIGVEAGASPSTGTASI
jgi:hypothetical protein